MQRMFQRIIRAEYSPVPQVSQAPLLAILGQQQNTQHTCCAFRFPRACLELPPHSIRITAATAPPEQNFQQRKPQGCTRTKTRRAAFEHADSRTPFAHMPPSLAQVSEDARELLNWMLQPDVEMRAALSEVMTCSWFQVRCSTSHAGLHIEPLGWPGAELSGAAGAASGQRCHVCVWGEQHDGAACCGAALLVDIP